MAKPLAMDVWLALQRMPYPDKDAAWKHMKAVGHKQERRFPGYSFLPRGGLSSPYVRFLTDADLIFNATSSGNVDPEDFYMLHELAVGLFRGRANLHSARIVSGGEELFDEDIHTADDMAQVCTFVRQGCDVATLTGSYRLPSGWHVPVDLTLQKGDKDMSKATRLDRILSNIEDLNFAKVVSRVRGMLKPAGKARLSDAWNRQGGALRFLVTQLRLVSRMPLKEQQPYLSFLQLPPGFTPEAWKDAAEIEMQHRALEVIDECKAVISNAFADRAGEIWDALESKSQIFLSTAGGSQLEGLTLDEPYVERYGTKGRKGKGSGTGKGGDDRDAVDSKGAPSRGTGKAGKGRGHGKDGAGGYPAHVEGVHAKGHGKKGDGHAGKKGKGRYGYPSGW
ncbi:unnamed protein product [Symbiodinium necroappetens]|uniref:Uncharacterized protein n=1 Tax=Symbiodinium necroappetens TaxID=1628268 RepID=A0A812TSY1_9DINO|nr:unnamed protein product [Symbiodinium necroappetens]